MVLQKQYTLPGIIKNKERLFQHLARWLEYRVCPRTEDNWLQPLLHSLLDKNSANMRAAGQAFQYRPLNECFYCVCTTASPPHFKYLRYSWLYNVKLQPGSVFMRNSTTSCNYSLWNYWEMCSGGNSAELLAS